MRNNAFLLLLILTFANTISAQMVGNTAYSILLKGLLSHSVNEITAEDAHSKLGNAVFIDAREIKEFEVSHIQNAVFVGYNELDLKAVKKLDLDKDQEIVVYCSIGYRSEKVAEKLKAKGFTNVHNLYGGIFEWKNRELPLVNSNEEPTDSIHAYSKSWGIWVKKGKKVY